MTECCRLLTAVNYRVALKIRKSSVIESLLHFVCRYLCRPVAPKSEDMDRVVLSHQITTKVIQPRHVHEYISHNLA